MKIILLSYISKHNAKLFAFYGNFCNFTTMNIVEVSTGKIFSIDIILVENKDYKLLIKSRYFFDWKEEKNQEVYKLITKEDHNILGLVSVERIPSEWRIHIRLLTVSKENKGNEKKI